MPVWKALPKITVLTQTEQICAVGGQEDIKIETGVLINIGYNRPEQHAKREAVRIRKGVGELAIVVLAAIDIAELHYIGRCH